ncbi:acyltransferase family protein [Cryptosporangium aurantiacum]|uniref:acyltransferase family protein n=1 Tax=Cryptosporangium aurantiacum TaxID=134849 RepID=UPI000934127D|nr:acyltransferase family protein [Cryptosporangium aurantiacum]
MKSLTGAFSYQPGLDGIRALAVGAVIVYHLGAGWLPGGFLGVDLFFVLSGFLITTLLVTRASPDGRVDLVDFAVRRVRRLLPAALVMVAVVAAVAAFTLPSYRLGALRLDGVWTVLQAANWRFVVSGQSYVDQFAPPSPLRHAWSLAVEEQFYLAWPLVLALALRLRVRRTWLLALTGGLALMSAGWMRHLYAAPDPSRSYYGTDTRAHALLVGAVLALLLLGPGRELWVRWLGRLAVPAVAGLLAAVVLVSDDWHGYYRGVGFAVALVAAAVIGAVAVAPDGPVGRVLAAGPLPSVGRLSYALYLWHWPVHCWLDEATPLLDRPVAAVVAKIVLTVVLALASYYLVEHPLRARRRDAGSRGARAGARGLLFAPAAVIATLGVVGVATVHATPSLVDDPATPGTRPRVLAAAPSPQAVRLATAGDSVAKSLAPGLRRFANTRGWGYVDSAVSSCSVAALLMVESDGSPYPAGRRCPDVVPAMQRALVGRYDPTLILVHSRWETHRVRRADGTVVEPGTAAHLVHVRRQLRIALQRLTAGRAHVVLIEPIPLADSLCRRLGHTAATCRAQTSDPRAERYNVLRRATAAEFPGRATVIAVTDLLCPGGECTDEVGERRPRPDGLHFSPEGAAWAAPQILRRAGVLG